MHVSHAAGASLQSAGAGGGLGWRPEGGAIMKLAFWSALQPASSHWSLAEGKTEGQSIASPFTPSSREVRKARMRRTLRYGPYQQPVSKAHSSWA